MPDFTLRQLEHFIAIAECGSISGAARSLHYSASTLSASLDELERVLSTNLVVRRKAHGVTLTPDGRAVLARSVEMMAQARDLQSAVDESTGGLSGPISIGCYHTLSPSVMPAILSDFSRDHPSVTIDYREADGDELQTAVSAGELDVAVMYDRDVVTDLFVQPLYSMRPYVLLSENHPMADATSVSLTDLISEPFVLFDLPPSAHNTLSLFAGAGLTPRVAHRTANLEFVRSLVRRELGWSILVQRSDDHEHTQGVVMADLTPSPPAVRVVMVRARGRARARVLAVEGFAVREFAAEP